MPKQTIILGTTDNDGTGDSAKVAGDKINDNFDELFPEIRTIAIPADSQSLVVGAGNIGTVLPWVPSRVEAEIIGPDEIGINSKEIDGGGFTVNGAVTYHFRGSPASGSTHTLELRFYK